MTLPPDELPQTPPPVTPPMPAPPPGWNEAQTLTFVKVGRRAIAILLDALVFFFAIAYPIWLTHKGRPTSLGARWALGWSVNQNSYFLSDMPALVAMGLWLAYMGVCEAIVGSSLGKAIVGIKVVRPDGEGVGIWRSVVRNAFRIIDILPILYLLGAILVWTTRRSQRLGDLVAGTVVVKRTARLPEPGSLTARSSRRGLALTCSLGVLAAVVAGYAWSGRGQAGVYSANGIEFHYPADWIQLPSDVAYQSGSPPIFESTFGPRALDGVRVAGYTSGIPVTEQNFPTFVTFFGQMEKQLLAQSSGTELSAPETTTVAGYPAIAFEMSFPAPGGIVLDQRTTIILVGSTEYEIGCQSEGQAVAAIQAGCEQVLRTFRVT